MMFSENENNKKDSKDRSRKKMALGRGLSALLPDFDSVESPSGALIQCNINDIVPNRHQPRRHFKEQELYELSMSIKEKGILQPLLVSKADVGYELITGERRLRAAKMAGIQHVPVVIKEVSEIELLELSIIENIQREDINPIEEANAYQKLITNFNLTQEQVSKKVGKSRSAITNFLRLRQLPDQIKSSLGDNTISMGHARALLGIDNHVQQKMIWEEIISKGLSVRETESLIKKINQDDKISTDKKELSPEAFYILELADNLSLHLGTKVIIKKRGKKGKVEIDFYNDEDLDRLISLLRQKD